MSEEMIKNSDNLSPSVEEVTAELPKGYMSKEDFVASGNDPRDYVTPEEFERRGKTFDYIKDLKKQLSSVVEYNQRIEKKIVDAEMRGYQTAIKELEIKRATAEESFDVGAVRELDRQIGQYQQAIQQQQQQSAPKEAVEFLNRHRSEFVTDPKLFERAVAKEALFKLENPGITNEDLYNMIEKDMFIKKEEVVKSKPTPVAPARSSGGGKSSTTFHDLSDQGKLIFNGIKRHNKDYTVEQFLTTAKNCGTVKGLIRGDE